MLTANGWIQRTRKRHLVVMLIVAVLVISQVFIQVHYHSKVDRTRAVLNDISLFERSLLSLSAEPISETSQQNVRAQLNQLSVDLRILDASKLSQATPYFSSIEAEISSLILTQNGLQSSVDLTAVHRILVKVRVLSDSIKQYESDLMHTEEMFSYVLSFLLITSLIICAVMLNNTFDNISSQYQGVLRRVLNNAKQASRKSKSAVSSRQRMVKAMRHELRTPIATVIGCLELIANASSESMRNTFVRKSRVASYQLLHELDALAQSDDIYNPFTRVNASSYNLLYLVDQCAAEFSINCKSKSLDFTAEFLATHDTVVDIDAQKFITVFLGTLFLTKSISSGAKVTCKVDVEESNGSHSLSIEIVSNHVTITQTQLDGIWSGATIDEYFSTDNNSFTRVPLIKHYCGLLTASHKMKVSAGRLVVHFSMPVKVLAQNTSEQVSELSGEYAIVDDLNTSLDYVSFIIETAGGKTTQFSSGNTLLSALGEGRKYQGIILDIHMPDVSGIDTLKMLSAMYPDAATPIIMISADAELLNQTMIENQSVEQVFSKPIDSQRLIDTLAMLETDRGVSPSRKNINVLLVEDDAISAEFVGHMLSSFGYSVCTVENGTEAQKALMKQRFDVALIDINLPDMTGYDIAEFAISNISRSKRPVMLALTANTLETDKIKSIEAGMKYHLCKPISLAELKKSIDLALQLNSING